MEAVQKIVMLFDSYVVLLPNPAHHCMYTDLKAAEDLVLHPFAVHGGQNERTFRCQATISSCLNLREVVLAQLDHSQSDPHHLCHLTAYLLL